MATFSTRLQELKETKKLLQKDAAKALDVPLRTYQRYEHGQQEPQLSTLIRMADFTGSPWTIWRDGATRGGRRRADPREARWRLVRLLSVSLYFSTLSTGFCTFYFYFTERRCRYG